MLEKNEMQSNIFLGINKIRQAVSISITTPIRLLNINGLIVNMLEGLI